MNLAPDLVSGSTPGNAVAKPAHRVGDMRCDVGESPVWHAREAALYWTDIPGKTLWRFDPATGVARHWTLPEMAGCMAICDGGWLLAMETGIFYLPSPLAQDGGAMMPKRLAAVTHAAPEMRFNDGRCDRQGRFWAGTMVQDMSAGQAAGCLYRFDERGLSAPILRDYIVPNGMAFSPDGRTMYVSDSHPSRQAVWAYTYDTITGTPHSPRLFIDMTAYPGRPDGAAVDAEGGYWICGNDAGMVHRFLPDGRHDRSIAVPVAKPAMCAFGGPNLDTLFITSIRLPSHAPESLDGAVFALYPGVIGLEEPAFVG